MAKPSQRDLARSGPRGGISGGELSGGLGGSDRPDERDPFNDNRDPDRPRTAGIFGGGGSGDREPTRDEPGLLQQAEDFLARTDKDIRAALGADPFQESFRPGRRSPNDERSSVLGRGLTPRPPEEDEIIPGDPSDLGARGNRRRTRDDVNASPVLRRGLLGV